MSAFQLFTINTLCSVVDSSRPEEDELPEDAIESSDSGSKYDEDPSSDNSESPSNASEGKATPLRVLFPKVSFTDVIVMKFTNMLIILHLQATCAYNAQKHEDLKKQMEVLKKREHALKAQTRKTCADLRNVATKLKDCSTDLKYIVDDIDMYFADCYVAN